MFSFPPVGRVAHEVGEGQQERGPVQKPVGWQQECQPARARGGGCMEGDGTGVAQQEQRDQRPGQVSARGQPYPQRVRCRAQELDGKLRQQGDAPRQPHLTEGPQGVPCVDDGGDGEALEPARPLAQPDARPQRGLLPSGAVDGG